MPAKGQLNQMIFASPSSRERNGYCTIVYVSDVQARHVDGVEPRVELSVPTPCRIEPVVFAAQERTSLLRISAVKDAVTLQERTYAKAHFLPRPFPASITQSARLQEPANILFCGFWIEMLAER